MNKTVELVKSWADFEEQHPNANIADFCRQYLAQQQTPKASAAKASANNCNKHFELSRTINQLSRLWMHFTQTAIRPFGLSNFEEFGFLYTVDAMGEIKKKDLIYLHFFEISSGLLVIDRLIKKDLLKEAVDMADKRSKLLTTTKKGKKLLADSRAAIDAVATEVYVNMPATDIQQAIRLLSPVHKENAKKWHEEKRFERDM